MKNLIFLYWEKYQALLDYLIEGIPMKTQIFSNAITNRNQIKFLYGFDEVVLDPYYITRDNLGKKFIYGRVSNSCEIKKFEYCLIANIKVFNNKKFSPRVLLRA